MYLHVQKMLSGCEAFFPQKKKTENKLHVSLETLGAVKQTHQGRRTRRRRTQRRTLSHSALGMRTRPEMVVSGPLKIAAADAPRLAPPVGQV